MGEPARERRGRFRTGMALAASLVLLGSGCGTRANRELGVAGPGVQQAPSGLAEGAVSDEGTVAGPVEDSAGAAARSAASTSAAVQADRLASPEPSGATRVPPMAGGTPSPAIRPVPTSGPSGSRSPEPPQAAKPGAPPPMATPSVPKGSTPLVVAIVGTFSGPAGSVYAPQVQGARLWVKSVNTKGGVNGHPIKLLVYDDSGDPARSRSQVQDAVENQKAGAFFGLGGGFTGPSNAGYIASKRVPVVGSAGAMDFVYSSPWYFPQASEGAAMYRSWLPAVGSQVQGKTKLGLLICTEIAECDLTRKALRDTAKGAGFDIVYDGSASIAQPDFTAECLSARNAGAEVMFSVMDSNSQSRIAASCARQGFRPLWSMGSSIAVDRHKKDPNLAGAVASTGVFPYFQSGTPATDEYQAAFKAFGGAVDQGVGAATGWTAGKLLERATASLPEPPTSEAILAGLWSIRNDDLGGLTYPLTFVEGKPAEPKSCWFNLQIHKGEWINPDGYQLHCS